MYFLLVLASLSPLSNSPKHLVFAQPIQNSAHLLVSKQNHFFPVIYVTRNCTLPLLVSGDMPLHLWGLSKQNKPGLNSTLAWRLKTVVRTSSYMNFIKHPSYKQELFSNLLIILGFLFVTESSWYLSSLRRGMLKTRRSEYIYSTLCTNRLLNWTQFLMLLFNGMFLN